MRVIGGRYRSRKLPARLPPSTRPTSDRLRETLFNILGPRVIESIFLDAYAGVGAVGIEALSRGASGVVFVDRSPAACRSIRRNLESLGIEENKRVQVRQDDLPSVTEMAFDIVFLDPPYERLDLYQRDLDWLARGGTLNAGIVIAFEHGRKTDLPECAGPLRRTRVHPQGDSALTFYRWESEWKSEETR